MPVADPSIDFVYSAGTMSLTNGSDIATGTFTAWDPAVLPYDFIFPNDGQAGMSLVAEVLDVDELRLVKPWTGPTLANVPYFIVRWIKHTDPRVYGVRLSDYLVQVRGVPPDLAEMLAGLAPFDSPEFTGTPRAPTPSPGSSSTRIATMEALAAAIESRAASGANDDIEELNGLTKKLTPAQGGTGSNITGTVLPFAGSVAPGGTLLCYGQAVSRTTFAALFDVIGTVWGAGNGTTTFNVPDMRGRAPFGKDNMGGAAASRVTNGISGIAGGTLGAVGGDERLHDHSHGFGGPNAYSSGAPSLSTSSTGLVFGQRNFGQTMLTNDLFTGGTSQNMPPAAVLNYIIIT